MNRRGKRIAFTVAATGLVVLLVAGILYRRVVLDHVGAWYFQFTTETMTIDPKAMIDPRVVTKNEIEDADADERWVGSVLDRPLIFAWEEWSPILNMVLIQREKLLARRAFKEIVESQSSFRVFEQHFPRRAYVVIRDKQ